MNYLDKIDRHKTFISFRFPEAKDYKDQLVTLSEKYNIFDNYSIGKGDIDRSEHKSDEEIRKIIVRDWISEATVTILLVGPNMSDSMYIDWEMHATMSDNENNAKMGLLCIILPETKKAKDLNTNPTNTSDKYQNLVKTIVGPGPIWSKLDVNTVDNEYKDLPTRVRKNLKREDSVKIDVISWTELFKYDETTAAEWIKKLIDKAFDQTNSNDYDVSDELQRHHR